MKLNKITIVFIILDILACIGLFLTYGPISYFRDLLVTTAMTTMNHRYLAQVFYSDLVIEKVLSNNYVVDSGEDSDTSHIVFSEKKVDTYASVYEEAILKRNEGDLYKVIPIKEATYSGYLVAIYDAKRVSLAMATNYGYSGQTLDKLMKDNDAIVGINASGFIDPNLAGNGGIATGIVIHDSKIINDKESIRYEGGIVGFNSEGVLMLTHKSAKEAIEDGMVDGMQFGPFLIVNGESSYIKGNGGWGINPRTAIGQRQDGIVLFLVIDGRQPGYSIGASITDVTKILLRYGAYNASNLDGGASSTLVVENEIINRPCGVCTNGSLCARQIPNAWILK